ncbi:MAG: hypothetical protein JRI23_15085, partial [Deltaproteobacteria bacterium]|nr:hypothetical protein [Deltaproteobacteria bacterium]MBW2533072.1 hypothetical protein [Deltaproteobacteria bacterium]
MMRALRVGAVVVVLLGIATARVVVSGELEIATSTDALRRGDARAAAVHARRAAGWYAPGAPHVRVAYDRLRALARAAEEHRQYEVALLAWRGIRHAALESRWIAAPYQTDLQLANRQIARLMALAPFDRAPQVEPDASLVEEQLELLERSHGARPLWVALLVASFVLAAVGMVVWAGQLGRALRHRRRTAAWAR